METSSEFSGTSIMSTSQKSLVPPRGNVPSVRRRLLNVPVEQLAISAVTEGVLRYGVARRLDAKHLQVW